MFVPENGQARLGLQWQTSIPRPRDSCKILMVCAYIRQDMMAAFLSSSNHG